MGGWLDSDNKAISVQLNLTGTGTGTELGNKFHPGRSSRFAINTLLPAPRLVWFPDIGPTYLGYVNRRDEVTTINEWVKTFNLKNNIK